MPVIIKGIDPKTVGSVTELVSDLEDKDAMQRLEPLVDDAHDLRVPQAPAKSKHVLDPPPADMPSPGDPIDYSHATDDDAGSAAPRQPGDLIEPPVTIDEPAVGSGKQHDSPGSNGPVPKPSTGAVATGSSSTGSATAGSAAGSAMVGSGSAYLCGHAQDIVGEGPGTDRPPPATVR